MKVPAAKGIIQPKIFGVSFAAFIGHVVVIVMLPVMMVPPEDFLKHEKDKHPQNNEKRYSFRILDFFVRLRYKMEKSVAQKGASRNRDQHKNNPRQTSLAK